MGGGESWRPAADEFDSLFYVGPATAQQPPRDTLRAGDQNAATERLSMGVEIRITVSINEPVPVALVPSSPVRLVDSSKPIVVLAQGTSVVSPGLAAPLPD
jgi:hypothetical protein